MKSLILRDYFVKLIVVSELEMSFIDVLFPHFCRLFASVCRHASRIIASLVVFGILCCENYRKPICYPKKAAMIQQLLLLLLTYTPWNLPVTIFAREAVKSEGCLILSLIHANCREGNKFMTTSSILIYVAVAYCLGHKYHILSHKCCYALFMEQKITLKKNMTSLWSFVADNKG